MQDGTPFEWAARPIKRFTDYRGRAPRAEYWWFYLAATVVQLPIMWVESLLETELVSLVYSFLFLIPWFAVSVRRLHDTDRSGWWIGGFFIAITLVAVSYTVGELANEAALPSAWTIVALIAAVIWGVGLFIFSVLPGTEGPNRYGSDPYGRKDDLEEVFA